MVAYRGVFRTWLNIYNGLLRFFKNGVMRNFAEITRKYPYICSFFKNETLAQVFSCEFCKFLRTPFLQNTTKQLLLIIAVSTVNYFRKKKLHRRCLTGLKIDFRLRVLNLELTLVPRLQIKSRKYSAGKYV